MVKLQSILELHSTAQILGTENHLIREFIQINYNGIVKMSLKL
uniref:Uncharacterized protein n=1 Tax=Borrelia garinii subsp. bavariensis (strain ATCC BAA-2496 / DSM 23469 / PBi) TaxID=290434 RepID=A0A7I6GXY1_BORGP|nr:hypothetical protein BGP274 [Borreliella bavariensis PBi]